MIPRNYIEQWSEQVPWQTLGMVEQDLIISRALIDLFAQEKIRSSLVFRGGTALNKLYLDPPSRYSEDIDFVQVISEPIGETITAIRASLDPWLGEPKRKLTERSVKLIYKYENINEMTVKLKVEINTTEHFNVLDLQTIEHHIDTPWFSGISSINTYPLEELMATKLRALYQRRKGRDLFDIWLVCSQNKVNIATVIQIFGQYCTYNGIAISKDIFTTNLQLKKASQDFRIDMSVLLPKTKTITWDFDQAFDYVQTNVIDALPL